jgi:hypothetical protein
MDSGVTVMPRNYQTRHTMTVRCATETCANSLTLRYDDDDSFIPSRWTCPVCEDALEQQMVEELNRRNDDTRNCAEPELTKEN